MFTYCILLPTCHVPASVDCNRHRLPSFSGFFITTIEFTGFPQSNPSQIHRPTSNLLIASWKLIRWCGAQPAHSYCLTQGPQCAWRSPWGLSLLCILIPCWGSSDSETAFSYSIESQQKTQPCARENASMQPR